MSSPTLTARQKRQEVRVLTQSSNVPSGSSVHSPGKLFPTGVMPFPAHVFDTTLAILPTRLAILPFGSGCGGPRQTLTRSVSFVMVPKFLFLHVRKTFHWSL